MTAIPSSPADSIRSPARLAPATPAGLVAAQLTEALALLDGMGAEADPRLRASVQDAHRLAAGLRPRRDRHDRHDQYAGSTSLEQGLLASQVIGLEVQMLARLLRARHALQVGASRRSVALALGDALPQGSRVVVCDTESDADAPGRLASAWGADRLDVRRGPVGRALASLAETGRCFDLVFLDADGADSQRDLLGHLQALLERNLLAPSAVVCLATPDDAARAAVVGAVTDEPRLARIDVPLWDGLTLLRRADA